MNRSAAPQDVSISGPLSDDPHFDAFATATSGWLVSPPRRQDIIDALDRFSAAARAKDGRWADLFGACAGDGLPEALSIAQAIVRAMPEGASREAARIAAAHALESAGKGASRPLFSADVGWRGDAPLSAAAGLLHALAEGYAGRWECGLIEQAYRHPGADVRTAALFAQVRNARLHGVDHGTVARLHRALIREPVSNMKLARLAAELIWTLDAPMLTQPLFGRFRGLVAASRHDPLLAHLLRRDAWHRVAAADRDAVAACAARLADVESTSTAFWNTLARPGTRLAVVGNSPCETGRGRGPEIDRHDMVIRFNDAPEDGRFAADYGVRCDAKVFAVANLRAGRTATAAPVIVIRRQSAIVDHGMAAVAEMTAAGKRIAYVPWRRTMALRAEIGRPASTGIAFLAQVRAVRGSLRNVACFGFSLTDQIAPGAASSHYFDVARAGDGHAWRAERALFDAWTAGG